MTSTSLRKLPTIVLMNKAYAIDGAYPVLYQVCAVLREEAEPESRICRGYAGMSRCKNEFLTGNREYA